LKCIVLVTYNPDIENNYFGYAEILVWAPLYKAWQYNTRFSSPDFRFIRQVHCV